MMEREHLHLLLNEEIYLIGERGKREPGDVHEEKAGDDRAENGKPEKGIEEQKDRDEKNQRLPADQVDYVFIHHTDTKEEMELLDKIIAACKLNAGDFKVYKEKSQADFKKAVIFAATANIYYKEIQEGDKVVMYAKPLNVMINTKEEKARLWKALQEFVSLV